MTVTLTTKNPVTGQQYRIRDASPPEWFNSYGADGAGFGYLTFTLHRRGGRDWPDIGHGYIVHLTKGPWRTLFHGQIVKITEQRGEQDSFTIWCLGFIHLLSSDTYNWVYCDTRWSAWSTDEFVDGDFHPDLFEWQITDDVLVISPRKQAEFTGTEYTAIRYAFEFGETLARFKADWALSLPSDYVALEGNMRLSIVTERGSTIWSTDANGSGSMDLAITDGSTWFEIRVTFTGAGTHTRDEDDVFAAISNIRVYSEFVTTLDAAVIAKDVAAYLYRSGYGLSASTDLIQNTGLALEPSAFVDDRSPLEILSWCARFGNEDGLPVAFGVAFDDTRRLFLEPWDLTSIRYVVKPNRVGSIERIGDWSESAQKVYGMISLEGGGTSRTSDIVATDMITRLGGYYRREAVSLDGVASIAEIQALVQLYLSERKNPKSSGSYVVKGVHTPEGREIPVEEIAPGGLVQVQEWRAHEATLSPNDYRDNTTTFMLVGVKVDLENQTAELSPSESSDSFARAMAIIQELKRG